MKKTIIVFAAIGVLSSLAACNGSDSDTGSIAPMVLEPKPDNNGSIQTLNTAVNTYGLPTAANIKFNDAGDAMAIWTEQTGIGIIANYSFKLASANQWSVPNIVYEQHDSQSTEYFTKTKFETDGSNFIISWIDGDIVYARKFSPAIGMLWTQKIVLNDNQLNNTSVIPNVQIASINGSILVVWFQNKVLYGREYKQSAWQATSELILDFETIVPTMTLSFINEFRLSASKNQYSFFGNFRNRDVVTGELRVQVFSLLYGVVAPSTWGVAKIINLPNIVGKVQTAKVLSTNSGFLYSWLQRDTVNGGELHLYSSEAVIANNSVNWATTQKVDDTTTAMMTSRISVAINSTGYGYVWDDTDQLDFSKQQISFRLYDKNLKLWSQSVVLSDADKRYRNSQITGVDSQYVIAWTAERDILTKSVSLTDVSATPVKINVPGRTDQVLSLVSDQSRAVVFWNLLKYDGTTTRYASGSSDLLQWDAVNLHAAINFVDNFYAPSFNLDDVTSTTFYNGQIWSSWLGTTMTDAKTITKNYVDVYDTDWQTFDFPAGNKIKTSGQMPKLITNAVGEVLSIWYQYHDGRFWIYASIRERGIWSEPVALIPARESFSNHLSQRTRELYRLATVRDKFIITWTIGSKDKLVKEYDGSKWLATVKLETGKGYFDTNILYAPIAFTENEQYRIFWIENNIDNNTFDIFEASKANNQWLVVNILNLTDPEPSIGSTANFSMAQSADNSYVVSFTRAGDTLTIANVYAQIFKNKQWVTDRQKISADSGNESRGLKSVGFGEGNFALAWQEMPMDFSIPSSGIYSSIYDGQSTNTWLPAQMVSDSINLLNVAANDSTVALVGVGGSSIGFHHYDLTSDSWPASQSMQYTSLFGFPISTLIGSGDSFIASWSDARLTSNIIPIVRFEKSQWSSVTAELIQAEKNSELFQPNLTIYRGEYALSWAQVDLVNSPSLSMIKTKIGGF